MGNSSRPPGVIARLTDRSWLRWQFGRAHLADEEDNDDTNEHYIGVVAPSFNGVDFLPTSLWSTDFQNEEGVHDGYRAKRQANH